MNHTIDSSVHTSYKTLIKDMYNMDFCPQDEQKKPHKKQHIGNQDIIIIYIRYITCIIINQLLT